MLYGYGGKILRINLNDGTSKTEPLDPVMAKEFLGGRGFVSRILYDEVGEGTDPLGPENKLIMASGPLSGTFFPCVGKVEFGAKSPATGGYGDSNMGGHLAPEMKYAGYDVVIFEDIAKAPCYVYIDDDVVEVRDASKYWGKGAIETEKMMKDDLGDDFQIATIGPAGENLVKFACISHDFGRQSGRTGVGCVMGSKNLKAIAVRGSKTIPLPDPEKALELGKKMFDICFSKPGFSEWTPQGTAGVTDWINEIGSFPTKNFQTGYFDKYKEINGLALRQRIHQLDKGCFGCVIPCGKYSKTKTALGESYVEGPEYETIAMIGGDCLIGTIEEVAYANYIMDELGLDTISGGNVVAFALECFEKGIITESEAGRKLAFGDLASVVYLSEKIAAREGIGDILAEGVRSAAERFGQGSERFAIHVKGLELSGYEPRNAPAMILAYMTADIGAHHNRAWAITYDIAAGRDKLEGKAEKTIELQHVRPLFDMLGACRFPWVEISFELEHYPDILNAITGQNYTWEDLMRLSERVWNLNRAYNIRHIPGFGRDYDYPPARLYEEPIPSGPTKGGHITLEQVNELLDRYYALRGWDAKGIPTRQKLEDLGLSDAADDVEAILGNGPGAPVTA